MAKRKRQTVQAEEPAVEPAATAKKQKATEATKPSSNNKTASTETIQVIVGFYDGVLHGLTATIGQGGKGKGKGKGEGESTAEFADTFLLTAHTKSIRCLAVSPESAPVPGQTQKRTLASGSADSKINLYELSAHPPPRMPEGDDDPLRHAAPRPILENKRNRELGSLEHHASAVTSLEFPLRSKLISASEDSTVAVTRTRDWALLSTLRAPMAKAEGRPSGDTAAFDGTPQGVNDFAVHGSMKLMLTASKGERKVRPWNLTTGKRAKALSYGGELLRQVGESRHASGEAKRLACGVVGGEDEFAVGFDRDVVVFGMTGEPRCTALGSTGTKVHQARYLWGGPEGASEGGSGARPALLAVSTEDGRVVLVSTRDDHLTRREGAREGEAPGVARTVASVGGREGGVAGRIKDFALVEDGSGRTLYVVGGGSDGVVRVWSLGVDELGRACEAGDVLGGSLVGTYATGNRITCLEAYRMIPNPNGEDDDYEDGEEFGGFDDDEEEEDGESSEDDDDEEEE